MSASGLPPRVAELVTEFRMLLADASSMAARYDQTLKELYAGERPHSAEVLLRVLTIVEADLEALGSQTKVLIRQAAALRREIKARHGEGAA